jgi:TonB family protein
MQPMYPSSTATANAEQSNDRRRHVRQRVRSLVYVKLGRDNGGIVLDVSEGGFVVQAANILTDEALAQVHFQVPQTKNRIEISGQIVWVGESKKEAGVKFLDVPDDARVQLKQWISSEASAAELQRWRALFSSAAGPASSKPAAAGPTAPTPKSAKPSLAVEKQMQDLRAAPAGLPPGAAADSKTGKQTSPMPAAAQPRPNLPEPPSPSAVIERQSQGPTRAADTGAASGHPKASFTDSLLGVMISQAASDSQLRHKWQRALALAGRQLPTIPAAHNPKSISGIPDPASPSAVVEGKGQDFKAIPAEPTSGRTIASGVDQQASSVPTASESTVQIPEPARPSPPVKTEMQESAAVAGADAPVSQLEKPLTPSLPATTTSFEWGASQPQPRGRIALALKDERVQLRAWWALAGLCGLLAVVSLSLRNSSTHQDVASTSSAAAAKGSPAEEVEASEPLVATPVDAARVARRESRERLALSSASRKPRASKSKFPAAALSRPTSPRRALMNDGLDNESASVLATTSSDANTGSLPIAGLASSAPLPAPPTSTLPQPTPEKLLAPSYLLYRVEPTYPRGAEERHIEGTVRMRALIGKDGRVRKVELVSGPPLLVEAAMNAARDWRYIPAVLNGQSVESEEDISIDFRLSR